MEGLLFLRNVFLFFCFFFFFHDPATTEIYTLSLHDALPIRPLLGRTCAPAPIGLAGPEERLLGHVEPAGPGVDSAHRIPLKTAERAVVGPAPMLGEHTRRALLRRRGRRGRRAL